MIVNNSEKQNSISTIQNKNMNPIQLLRLIKNLELIRIHMLFEPIPELTDKIRGKKNGESIISDTFPVRVILMRDISNCLVEDLEQL